MSKDIIRTDYDLQFGERYRKGTKGDSSPTVQKWADFERKRKDAKKHRQQKDTDAESIAASAPAAPQGSNEFTERDKAIVKALNAHYGERLPEGTRHETWLSETAPWILMLTDNNAKKALLIGQSLDYVRNWEDQAPGELESCIDTVQRKPLLQRRPKRLREILQAAGISEQVAKPVKPRNAEEELPFDEWVEKIRSLFDTYPCLREVCEPHPERLWPFLLFAAGAIFGTLETLTWWYFYDQPEQKRRLNYNVLGIGDPASGKGALTRVARLLTEPIELSDQMANDAINLWKEEQRTKGSNKDKTQKPKAIVRLHGARTSNTVFITDMNNAVAEVEGEIMHEHMLTIDTEALNSINMQKGGSWIDRQVLEIKAFSNERDSQQYANIDSVTGAFNVYWNQVRTCTPPALAQMVNDRNFGTGLSTRLAAIPVPGTGFKMMELRRQSQKATDADKTLTEWAYRMDKRQGELPLWPLVEHCWDWTNKRMEIAAFNEDKADEMLLKRCAYYGICISAPWIDMRHFDEREKTGSYEVDDTDKQLCSLVLDIQYRTQHYYFGEMARNYFDNQMTDAANFRRRTSRYSQCYQQLPQEFSIEQFTKTFGFATNQSASRAINRLLGDKAIIRIRRGEYRKRVQNIV